MIYRVLAFVTALSLLGASALATAGAAWSDETQVTLFYNNSAVASGSLRSARSSGDSRQSIGCQIDVSDSTSWGSCFVVDAADNWNETGTCTNVSIANSSVNLSAD